MTDLEVRIKSDLERILPLPDGSRADWADVLQRADFPRTRHQWRAHLLSTVRPERGWRPALVAAALVVALALASVAIADGFGAFNGISAAQRPQTAADRLDASDLPPVCNNGSPIAAQDPFCHLIFDSARVLSRLPDGGKLWVVTDTKGDLCVLLQQGAASCNTGLTPSQPTTITSAEPNDETQPISWGITLDDVAAVSFPVSGHEVTVPVNNNVWFYQGDDSGLASMTIHFRNGSTVRPQSDEPSSSGG